MTTVCFDGKTFAADTRQVGSYIDCHHAKKIYKSGSAYIGYCGEVQQAHLFIKWFQDQTKPRPDPDHLKDFSAIVIRGRKAYHASNLCELVECGTPCAIGSGGDFAIAAMLGGADAVKAVKIAMRLDPYTGGKVRSVTVR